MGFSFHDTFIEFAVELGWLGVALLVITLVQAIWRSVRLALADQTWATACLVAIAFCLIFRTFDEVDLPYPSRPNLPDVRRRRLWGRLRTLDPSRHQRAHGADNMGAASADQPNPVTEDLMQPARMRHCHHATPGSYRAVMRRPG